MLFPIILAIVGGLLTKAPIASIRQPSLYLDPALVFKPSSFVYVSTATLADAKQVSSPCTAPSAPPLTLSFPSQAGVVVSVIGKGVSNRSGIDIMQEQLYVNALRDGQDYDLISPFSLTYVCNGSSSGIVLWNNRKVQHALPASLAVLHSSLPAFSAASHVKFHVNNHPIEYKISRPANNVAGYIIVLMVAMSFAPGFPAYVAVQERVSKSRHLLRVMGMRSHVYWLTYYAFDLVWQYSPRFTHRAYSAHLTHPRYSSYSSHAIPTPHDSLSTVVKPMEFLSHIESLFYRYTFVIGAIVIAITFEIDGLTDGPFHAMCLLLSLATTNNIVLMYMLSFFVDDPVMMQVRVSMNAILCVVCLTLTSRNFFFAARRLLF
jgi:hypothetical protein